MLVRQAGIDWLIVSGQENGRRPHGDVAVLDVLLDFVASRLPASYGLLYESSDEPDMPEPPGAGAYTVRVLEAGVVRQHLDPFMSPILVHIGD